MGYVLMGIRIYTRTCCRVFKCYFVLQPAVTLKWKITLMKLMRMCHKPDAVKNVETSQRAQREVCTFFSCTSEGNGHSSHRISRRSKKIATFTNKIFTGQKMCSAAPQRGNQFKRAGLFHEPLEYVDITRTASTAIAATAVRSCDGFLNGMAIYDAR